MKNLILLFSTVLLLSACDKNNSAELIYVEANTESGFNFPYFLLIPQDVSLDDNVYVIVEPNNSGFVDDDFEKHLESAKHTATNEFYMGNFASNELKYPLLVPVFPRPARDWKIYTHALDRDAMRQKDTPIERIDLQLINMFEDARERLKRMNVKTQDQFLLTGFSASGTFVNRFTLLHPDKVFAAAAGGLNGLLILPIDSINSFALNYPLGINDIQNYIDTPYSRNLFLNTPQYYFMGEMDNNDAIGYDDAFDEDERLMIYNLLGKQMQPERWENCKNIYFEQGVKANIKTFENTSHEAPENIKHEICTFFRNCINKENESPK